LKKALKEKALGSADGKGAVEKSFFFHQAYLDASSAHKSMSPITSYVKTNWFLYKRVDSKK